MFPTIGELENWRISMGRDALRDLQVHHGTRREKPKRERESFPRAGFHPLVG